LTYLLVARGPRKLIAVAPETSVEEAIELIYAHGISQLPVIRAGQGVGSIQEVTLARILHDRAQVADVAVEAVMARALPQVAISTHLDEAYRLLLAGNTGVLVTDGGQVIDIITRIDLVRYWNQQRAAALAA
jgi:cystathionine beta-synthase